MPGKRRRCAERAILYAAALGGISRERTSELLAEVGGRAVIEGTWKSIHGYEVPLFKENLARIGEFIEHPQPRGTALGDDEDDHEASYEKKRAGLLQLCADAKRDQVDAIVIHSPQMLGDNYDELVNSLNRIADAGLKLVVVPPAKRA
jgi:hypothetical protein